MFIELDDEHIIRSEEVVTILDIQLTKTSIKLKNLLKYKKNQNELMGNPETGKAIIITDEYIYYSSQSPLTLKKRFNRNEIIRKISNY
ncbi:MAG TPA: extracellular matrix/biofilm biosynthesis regulator RemA family protein [Pseudogracilibacillus sp.]|nr:extracellular matrix/biofilm biosynthesis regulator RemA family protein [Pseudogracilibacillus sp.]